MKYLDTKKDSLEEAISKAINKKVSAADLVSEGGKYLKYSDLLLQKGRLMAKNQSTAMIDKEIKKEMGKLGIKEKLDPVGKEDGDVDNDGDKDASDKYLAKKRKAITKSVNKEEDVDLEAKTTKNVDETLDRIREANLDKGRSMREILADIWKMNEGKSPFEKLKKEEGEKGSSKTMTGKKATKVEIEPEIE